MELQRVATKDTPNKVLSIPPKRRRECSVSNESPRKRFRSTPTHLGAAQPEASSENGESQLSYITQWLKESSGPMEGFGPGATPPRNNDILARKKSIPSLQHKWSGSSTADSTTSSDQGPRELKTAIYAHRSYSTWPKAKGVCMERSALGISDESKSFYLKLLKTECNIPEDTIFREDILEESIEDIQDKNESRIIQDIARLLVPSVRSLARMSERRLDVLVESVNEGWNNCIPLTEPRPQPDFAVGIGRHGFGDNRIKKLQPLVGDESSSYYSHLMATHYMYFPFLTSEVKSATAGIDIADRQNAHSMGVAIKAIFLIFRLAKRHRELHRKLLTFSISHDHRTVRLHGWYPVIDGDNYTVYRHLLHAFDIVALEGKEKWTTRRFSVGVYRYGLTLLGIINAVIDELPPDLNLESVPPRLLDWEASEHPQQSGPSQRLEDEAPVSEHPGPPEQLEHQALAEGPVIPDKPETQPQEEEEEEEEVMNCGTFERKSSKSVAPRDDDIAPGFGRLWDVLGNLKSPTQNETATTAHAEHGMPFEGWRSNGARENRGEDDQGWSYPRQSIA
ncbi:hypothetical protein PRK78_005061 [Emydomyces testavorans]|uniref:DUF7924 domain-containing protein n=1 Tax=Emydomyces testavorans TaxID=2070801 RepID=A0AAF0DL15_9EURO|nr:hypothetical protein PRK78_005061 [Emydomyces testavorans]